LILTIIWWLRKLRRDSPKVKEEHRSLTWRDNILKKLNDVGVEEQRQIKISNRFAALENLDNNVCISRAWGNIRA